MSSERSKVEIGGAVRKDGKILLGKRKNSNGKGCWAHPEGHREFNESFERCVRREVYEETGRKVKK